MLKNKSITLLSMMIVMVILLTGCSDSNDNPAETSTMGTDEYLGMNFTQPYGGLTSSDEYEAFDDEDLKAMMYAEDGEEYSDQYVDDTDINDMLEQGESPGDPNDPSRPRFTFLRLRWGMVRGPGDSLNVVEPPCDLLDWTGEIHTDRGIVLVRRAIRFDSYDHLVRPRLNRKTVAFVSHTSCHYDGLLLQIIESPDDFDPENTEPNRLHINTGPFQGVYEVEALAGLNEINEIDDLGNLIQLNGFTLSDTEYCPKGFLSGRFRPIPADADDTELRADDPGTQMGRMAGMYMDLTGRISGFLRGGYGLDENGNRVFHAKYIDRRGTFHGLLTGTWENGDELVDFSSFEGHWVSASGQTDGLVGGNAHSVEGQSGGFFEGRWTAICDQEAEDQVR